MPRLPFVIMPARDIDIVFAHGSQYGASVQEIAPDFPKTTFAWGTDVNTFGMKNVYAYTAAAQEGGYVNGVMAAMLTKSKKVGVTGPVEAGDAKTYIDGFVQGVASVDKTIEISKTWTGSFSDVALMTEAAKTHIAAGADALTGSSQSVVGSIGAAKDKGNVLWFGTSLTRFHWLRNWWSQARFMIGLACLRDHCQTQFRCTGRRKIRLQLKNDGLKIAFNPGYKLPADVKAAADKAIAGIKSGTITVEP